eukprot:3520078-Amphidinium_carterae.1
MIWGAPFQGNMQSEASKRHKSGANKAQDDRATGFHSASSDSKKSNNLEAFDWTLFIAASNCVPKER